MPDDGLLFRPLTDVAELIRRRETSPVQVTENVLQRIERVGPALNCFITVVADRARQQSRAMEILLESGTNLGELHGIPISVKDNINTSGIRTTMGSPIFFDWSPDSNAVVVDHLVEHGAVLTAKDNLYDFAYCGPNPKYGPTHNPWDLTRSCAGSSSGSAAAVAAGLSFGSVGTDGGGSIRAPASFCGVVGVKPTFGLVDRSGEFPLNPTLSVPGPIARTVRDAATILGVMVGDAAHGRGNYLRDVELGVNGLRLGVLPNSVLQPLDPEIEILIADAYTVLQAEGAILTEIELPDFALARAVMWALSGVEVAEYLRPIIKDRMDELHPVTRMLVERAEFIPATEYIHAQRVRQKMILDARRAMSSVDAVILPTTPIPAYPIGTRTMRVKDSESDVLDLFTRFAALFNLLGLPALTVPCGFTAEGLPAGLQVAGHAFREAMVFRVARAYERSTPWVARRPADPRPASGPAT